MYYTVYLPILPQVRRAIILYHSLLGMYECINSIIRVYILGGVHKLCQIFRGEGGLVKTWHFLTRGEGGLPNIWRQKIVIFYAEILTKKVVLGCFFTSETSEIIQNSNFQMGWKSNQVITPTFPKNLEAFTCYE